MPERPQNKHLRPIQNPNPLQDGEHINTSRNRSSNQAALAWWAALSPLERGEAIVRAYQQDQARQAVYEGHAPMGTG